MSIEAFISRCDRYCKAADVSRTWLSKRLLADTYWLDNLAKDKAGISVKRFERVQQDLAKLEAELQNRPRGPAPQGAAA